MDRKKSSLAKTPDDMKSQYETLTSVATFNQRTNHQFSNNNSDVGMQTLLAHQSSDLIVPDSVIAKKIEKWFKI